MQRINLFLMVLCFLAITNKANAWTGSGTAASPWLIGDSSTNTVSAVKAKLQGDTLLTIFGTGNMADFPYSTEGQTPWRQAGKHTLIKTVVIESGVTNIGDIAFQDCSNLQWITIPEGVTIIGTRAFENCVSLSAVSIPNTATTIESQAFKNCTDLISVNNNANIPQSNVASNAFSGVTVSNVYLTVPLAPLNDYKQATVWRNFNVKSQYVRFTENLGNDVDEMIVDPDGTLYYYQYRDAAHTIPLKLIIHNKANDSHPTIVTYNESGLPSTITTKNSTVLFDNYEENHCSVTQISANSINESVLQISGWWSEIQDMWDTPLDKTNNILSLVGTALSFVDNGGFVSMDPQLGAITALVEFAGLDEMCPALKPIITGINVLGTVIDCGVAYFSGETNILADVQCALGIWNLAVTIYNARHQNSDIKTWNYDWNYSLDYGVLTIYGTGVMTQPSGGYPWANRKSEITKLIIRSGVTSIPRSAFSGCDNLTTVTIEAGSDTLYVSDSYSTFYNTPIQTLKLRRNIKDTYGNNFTGFQKTTLTSLEIGNQVTFIDNSMFSGCTGLTSVNIPTSVKSIGSSAFSGCTNLKTLTIGNKVTSIGNHAFDNTALTDLTIPSSVKEIGSYAFDGCKFDNVRIENSTDTLSLSNSFFGSTRSDGGIKSLYLGRNISYSYTITGSPFDSDTLLVSVTMGDNVTYIGRNFFNGCKNLKTVSLSSNITSIGYRAFYGCSSLSSIDIIPLTVTSIGDYAFNNCKEIKSLVLPASVTEIGYNAFSGCTNLQSVKTDMTFIPNNIFSGCTNLKTLTIGNKVTSIGNNAFNNTALTDLTIPSSVKEIGFSAFGSCKFDNVRIENSTDTLSLSNSFFGSTRSDGGIKSLYLGRNISYSYTITGSPFDSDTLLVSVTMGDNVTYIGRNFFNGCKNLKTVSLSSNITSIGYRAFYGCSSLSSIDIIPLTVTSIGDYAFNNCKEIKSLVLPASVTEIGYNAFSGCTNLQSVKTDMTFIPNNIFSGCTNLKTLTIGNKVTSIGNNAFNNTALTDLTIPSSVKEIGFSAFGSCKFDNVRIENSTDTLSLSGSFLSGGTSRSDGGIKSLYLGRNISYTGFNSSILPGSPFESDTLLVSVTMGDNVTYIGSDLFYGCKNLKTVSLSSNITSIGYRAFYGCSNLSQIISKATIPPKLSNYTFYNVPTNIPVYVPCGAYTNYRDAQYWSSFTNFVDYCTQVTPAETSAVISWTAIENTEYYKIAVYADEAHTQVIGQYRVDATGNITRLRNTTEQNELSLSVTNLSASTPYSFTITAYGNNNTEVVTFSGDFTTLSNDIAYIVTFDSRGGSSVSSQQITSGQRVSEPTAPTKSGYNFGGWYRESSCTNVWNFNNDVITSNVMLYAKWTPTSYIVVYNGNGNTGGSTSSSTHTYDVAKNLTANGFTKTGYAFAGWATSATGSVEYSNGQSVSNLTAANNGTVNLYAKWTLTTVAVTGVTLNQNTASLIAGNTLQLTETVLPSNASDKSRTWSSSNISVASVNSSGLVTAKSAGSATITLTTRDGGKKATCVVTVSSPSLTLSSTAYNFIAGGGTSPAITVTSNVSWTVSDDATWIITSKTNGSNNSTFTMTAEANTAIFPRSATITVTGGGITKTISVTQNAALLPVQNYQVKTTNCTCRGTDDGAIDISFNKSLNYTVKVTGNNYSKTDTATSNYHLSGLAAGTYTVAITISGLTGYQQDFTVVVSQPESLNVLKADVATGTAQYVMSGGETYHITVNGITRTTRSNTVEIPLQNGENRISIRTEKSCQGVYEETVFFNGQITLFPNPADVQVTISIPGEDEQVTVEIFSMSGSRQYKEKLTVSSDRLVHINVSGYSSGTYLVKVSGATIQDIVRMVKK